MNAGSFIEDNSDVLLASFDALEVTLQHKYNKPIPDLLGRLYTVESYGVVLLPPTDSKREALAVYEHSQSREKTLLIQQGSIRSILFTNVGQIREKDNNG